MKKLILGYEKLRGKKASREEIDKFLMECGIPKNKVADFIEVYDIGFKSGVSHVITGGLSSADIEFGKDPVFDSAFNMGKHLFRRESSLLYRYRMPIFIVIALIIAALFKIIF
jgi:hypothetical protein